MPEKANKANKPRSAGKGSSAKGLPPDQTGSRSVSRKARARTNSKLPTKWLRDTGDDANLSGLVKKAEEIEKTASGLRLETLKNLNYDELKEVYQSFSDIDDEEAKSLIVRALDMVKKPSIEKARLGHRIWSYFYEKIPIRLFLLFWLFLASKLKNLIPDWMIVVDPDSISQMPPPLANFIFIENTAISLGMLMAMVILVLVWISWRIWVAWLESNKNSGHPGSTYFRHNIGIVVVNKKGRAINPLFSFLRGLFRIFPLSLLSVVSMEVARSGRAIHDRLFHTYVLRIYRDVDQEEIAHFIKENY